MIKKKYSLFFTLLFLGLSIVLNAQHTTINPKDNSKPVAATTKHKVMLIPFESRMYMSEIDYAINAESKLSAKQIKYSFRDGINEQLYKAFKSKYSVVDLMDDTTKTKKDLENIYQYLSYEYVKVPDQTNYTPPKKEKDVKAIEKGQVMVETDSEKRFMNAKVKNATLVPYLYGKYKSDLFVFINQLDIKSSNSGGPADLPTNDGNRKIIVHYTVYTFDAKEINSGIAEVDFPSTINMPSKIVGTYFSKIAQTIVQRVDLALAPKVK